MSGRRSWWRRYHEAVWSARGSGGNGGIFGLAGFLLHHRSRDQRGRRAGANLKRAGGSLRSERAAREGVVATAFLLDYAVTVSDLESRALD